MKQLLLLLPVYLLLTACNNNGDGNTARLLCDTTCVQDSFKFTGTHKLKPQVSISMRDCLGDTISWTHEALPSERKMLLSSLIGTSIRLTPASLTHYFKDTSYVVLTFNDCSTGRGFLLKLPFNKQVSVTRSSAALNRIDPKFAVADSLRAYTDRGSIFVTNIMTGEEAQMTFGERYDINFDNIHEVLDSIHITNQRIWVRLKKNGQNVDLEKAIEL